MNHKIQIKRVYEKHSKSDGFRILVDRLWPRGLTKEAAHVDLWMKDIAPSNELRKWYHQDMSQWLPFRKKYFAEIKNSTSMTEFADECAKHQMVTLLYGSKDEEHNHAQILIEVLSGSSSLI
jgi:uncharacterized protein YeaO (DUF488 family)